MLSKYVIWGDSPTPGKATGQVTDCATQTPMTPVSKKEGMGTRGRSSIPQVHEHTLSLRRSGRLASRSRSRGRNSPLPFQTPGLDANGSYNLLHERSGADYSGLGLPSPNIDLEGEEEPVPAKRMKTTTAARRTKVKVESSPVNKSSEQKSGWSWRPSFPKWNNIGPTSFPNWNDVQKSFPKVDAPLPKLCLHFAQLRSKNPNEAIVKEEALNKPPQNPGDEEMSRNAEWKSRFVLIWVLFVFAIIPLRSYLLSDWPPAENRPSQGGSSPASVFGRNQCPNVCRLEEISPLQHLYALLQWFVVTVLRLLGWMPLERHH